MNFDMLRLSALTLADSGGNPDSFFQRIEELEERYEILETEAAQLQQEIYDAVQVAWKRQKGEGS